MRPDEWAHRHCPRRTANRPVCGTWPTQSTDFFAVRLSLQTFCGRGPSAVQEQYQIRPGIFLPWMSPIRLDGLEGITIKSGWFPGGKGGRHVPLSRRDISRIARRFNAGKHRACTKVPKGRLKPGVRIGPQASLIRFPQLFIRWRGEPREAPRSQR